MRYIIIVIVMLITEQAYAAGRDTIILYSRPRCGYCTKARYLLANSNVRYIEYNIESNRAAYQRFKQLGGRGVPLIEAKNILIRGYQEPLLRQLVAERRYRLR